MCSQVLELLCYCHPERLKGRSVAATGKAQHKAYKPQHTSLYWNSWADSLGNENMNLRQKFRSFYFLEYTDCLNELLDLLWIYSWFHHPGQSLTGGHFNRKRQHGKKDRSIKHYRMAILQLMAAALTHKLTGISCFTKGNTAENPSDFLPAHQTGMKQ